MAYRGALAGTGADLRRRDLGTAARRLVTVPGMGLGAFVGAVLVLGVGLGAGLVGVAVVTAAALLTTALSSRVEHGWTAP